MGNELFAVDYQLDFIDGKAIVKLVSPFDLTIKKGRQSLPLCEFFNIEYPTIKFTDQSLLEGNILVKIPKIRPSFNEENIVVWDWENIDIHKESQGLSKETDSIQFRVIDTLKKQGGYDIVFDDDGPGEIADVVCISANSNEIVIDLYHCKYSHGDAPGARVSDLYEVCGQAEKAVKWCQDYKGIIDRMCHRETERSLKRGSRIEVGDTQTLMKLRNMIRFYKVKLNMYIVQPGVDSTTISEDMASILNGTAAYLLETYSIPLKLICS